MPNATPKEKARNIDWVGIVLFVGALATLIMAIDFGGVEWSWGSGSSIALFVVSGVLFVVFGVQQTFYILCNEENRLFPIHFLKRRSLLLLFILNSEYKPIKYSNLLAMLIKFSSLCQQRIVYFSVLYSPVLPIYSGKIATLVPKILYLLSCRVILQSTPRCVFYPL